MSGRRAAAPADLHGDRPIFLVAGSVGRRSAEPEVQPALAVGGVTPAGPDPPALLLAADGNGDPRAEAVALSRRVHQPQPQEGARPQVRRGVRRRVRRGPRAGPGGGLAPPQRRRVVLVGDDDLERAVGVEVERRQAARRSLGFAEPFRPVAAGFPDEQLVRLPVTLAQGGSVLDLRVEVAVRERQVEIAVVLRVEEDGAPAEGLEGGGGDADPDSVFEEQFRGDGAVEGVVVVGEVRHRQVEPAVPVGVRGGDAHAPLGGAVRAERHAGEEPHLLEAAAVVRKQRVRPAVVGHEEIRVGVVVEVERGDPHGVPRRERGDSPAFRGVAEGPVAASQVEAVGLRFEPARPVEDRNRPAPAAGAPSGADRNFGGLDVVGHEEIGGAVPVGVEERGPEAPAVVVHAGGGADFGEGAVAVVAEEEVAPQRGQVEIGEAVGVEVGAHRSLAEDARRDAGGLGYFAETPAALVPVERAGAVAERSGRVLPGVLPVRRVREVEIREPVLVVVEHRHPGPGGLGDVVLRRTAGPGNDGEPDFGGDVAVVLRPLRRGRNGEGRKGGRTGGDDRCEDRHAPLRRFRATGTALPAAPSVPKPPLDDRRGVRTGETAPGRRTANRRKRRNPRTGHADSEIVQLRHFGAIATGFERAREREGPDRRRRLPRWPPRAAPLSPGGWGRCRRVRGRSRSRTASATPERGRWPRVGAPRIVGSAAAAPAAPMARSFGSVISSPSLPGSKE